MASIALMVAAGLAAFGGLVIYVQQFSQRLKEEQQQFLALDGRRPARLTVEQAAWVLGCQPHDVPILISSRLLRPLGNPPQNAIKFFSTAEVTEIAKDRAWLAKMTQTISQHWHKRNMRQKSHCWNSSENGLSALLNPSKAASG